MIEPSLAIFGGFVLFVMGVHHLRHFMVGRYARRLGITPEEFLRLKVPPKRPF